MKSQTFIKMVESEFFDGTTTRVVKQEGFQDIMLLRSTAYATLYRASKAGKFFLIKATRDGSERQVAMLRREYELAIGGDHPHIVHIYTYEENLPMGASIIMEYIEGRTLAEYLAENPSTAERKRIFEELLSAVGYIHKRGIIHNDLKPENILISRADNSLKLIDFGLADSDVHFVMRTLGYTPAYASPELSNRCTTLDARSDIYSLGIILRQLLGTRYRFITARCLMQDPAQRYDNVEALQSAIHRRNNRWKHIVAIICIALIATLTMLYFSTKKQYSDVQKQYDEARSHYINTEQKYQELKSDIENKAKTRELLYARIENKIVNLYNALSDSVSNSVYQQFGASGYNRFANELVKYKNDSIDTITDIELATFANSSYLHLYSIYANKLVDEIEELPFLSFDNMSSDEKLFYNLLRRNGLPYRPYSKEEAKTIKDKFL